MRFLLDTHLLLWALNEPTRMGETTRDAIEDPANDVLFSTASIWEDAARASRFRGSSRDYSERSNGAGLRRTADPVAIRLDSG
jgi:hypothetical protein